jgi:hypothetical protein
MVEQTARERLGLLCLRYRVLAWGRERELATEVKMPLVNATHDLGNLFSLSTARGRGSKPPTTCAVCEPPTRTPA